jgi:hypothetical protein
MRGGEKLRFKKSILIGIALFFAVGILAFSVVRVSAAAQSQNYKIAPVENVSTEKVATQEAQANNDYFLAYPGLLPDHPLYSLKMVRDRIWLWLTNNPLKKAELLLLFADKRLGAAKALIEGNKVELGISTMTKGEKYLERAIAQGKMAAEKGEDTQAFLEKLSQATLKHQEVLAELVNKVPESFKGSLEKAVSDTQKDYQQVQELLKQ